MLLTCIAVWIDSPGASPVFSQLRVGRNGKLFRLYKFRSMCPNAESKLNDLLQDNEMDGPVFKMKDDPRITRVGHFIRKTSIDELPQLVNILKGDMSIVGPRPALPREVAQYTPYEWQRLYVTPGLSCYWQIAPHRNQLSFEEWMALALSPLMLLTCIAVWIDSPGASPVFSQLRVGRNGKLFRLYKFRSMCPNAESKLNDLLQDNEMDGPVFKMKDDPRITRVGHFIRKTSIDELPQLVNILKGDMSIVGPRPALPREVAQYTPYEWQRLYVTPGLSCYWQIAPHRNQLSFEEWMALAIGSGGIFGNGLFSGRYYSVPNAHNDFILSWLGNAIGFVGLCIVLGALLALVIKTFATGARSEDLLGSYICTGIGGALMAQIAVNVGMNLRVLPVIGVTLPFYSAGGSSVLMLYICVGLVLSVYMHNTKSLFG